MNKEILTRYIFKETNKDENKQVERWIAESDENKKILEQLYFVSEVNDKLKIQQSLNVEEALARFKQRINKEEKSMGKGSLFRTLQRIAAALFIPLLGISIYLYMANGRSVSPAAFIETTTSAGMVSSFTLPDGSSVWLNSNSTLRYPSSFDGEKREVEIQGQAYFEVVKNTEQPFLVKTKDHYSVEVLGTRFTISAYEDEDIIETTLVSGSVKVNSAHQQRTLIPNEKAVYMKDNDQLAVSTVDSEYDIIWRTGKLKFRNHGMDHVLRLLSRQYNVSFEVTNKHILDAKITASFDNEPLPQILEYIRLASGIKFQMQPIKAQDGQVRKQNFKLSL